MDCAENQFQPAATQNERTMGEECHREDPLLTHGQLKRTGNVWSAVAHIITAVIGSGVLSLAWSVAQLGWIVGPLSLLFFAVVTTVSSFLLCDCYRSPHPEHGHIRNPSYMDAVKLYLGRKSVWACGLIRHIGLFGTGIAYTITASISMSAIQRSNCFHKKGHAAQCAYGHTSYMLLFGATQIVCSQIPNFHYMEWLSVVAATMSFSYSFIGLALGFTKVIENGLIKGSIGGVPTATPAEKVWNVSQALGDMAFSYPFSKILFEIQDTLKSSPPENQTMKKASRNAILITTILYFCCGCFGYAAFGNKTPGNLLTGFGFYEPYWLIDFANACIAVHLVGGYQVFSQANFAFLEGGIAEKYPNYCFVNKSYTIRIPFLPVFSLNILRLCLRTIYVLATTGVAMLFPYFNPVLGVLGAFAFWPLIIYFPVQMYIVQMKIGAWTGKWVLLHIYTVVCFIIALFALIGSIKGLVTAKLG